MNKITTAPRLTGYSLDRKGIFLGYQCANNRRKFHHLSALEACSLLGSIGILSAYTVNDGAPSLVAFRGSYLTWPVFINVLMANVDPVALFTSAAAYIERPRNVKGRSIRRPYMVAA